MNRYKNERGFTLIELMATLAILAIIIAIAIPAVGNLLDKADASADDSSIELMERSGELADVDGLAHDEGVLSESGSVETEAYRIPTLIEQGFLNMEEDNKFNKPENYVVKVNESGTYVYKGEGQRGGGNNESEHPGGFLEDVVQITSCEEAIAEGYDKCITNVEELMAISDDMFEEKQVRYIVMNDIDLSGVENWEPLAKGPGFNSGSELNGNGYSISNMTIDRPTERGMGLFYMINGSVVKNLWLKDIDVTGGAQVAGLAGQINSTRLDGKLLEAIIDNVVVDGKLHALNPSAGMIAGNVYSNDETFLSNIYVAGDITAGADPSSDLFSDYGVGGAVGTGFFNMRDSESAVNITAKSSLVGGLAGEADIRDGSNLRATGDIYSEGSSVGGLVGFSFSGDIDNSYATGAVYSGAILDFEPEWGDRFGSTGGLIGTNVGATVTNSYATGSVTVEQDFAGGLIGFQTGGSVTDSHATGDVVGGGNVIGGLFGQNNTPGHKNVYATGNVTSTGSVTYASEVGNSRADVFLIGSGVGGLIGVNNGEVDTAYATGDVKAEGNTVAGLIGYNTVPLSGDMSATGDVSTKGDYVGGLIGENYSGASGSVFATGDVTTKGKLVGGLMGYNSGASLQNAYATGDVTSEGEKVGGLVGDNYNNIQDSYYEGTVTTKGNFVGGLTGDSKGQIVNSYAIADITSEGSHVGGLSGALYSPIMNSHFEGSIVTFGSKVGGLAGETKAPITGSYVVADITTTGDHVGGLVGDSYGDVTRSSYSGSISTNGNYVGGLVGETKYRIFDSFAIGDVSSAGNYVGGLAGMMVSASDYDMDDNRIELPEIEQSFASVTVNGAANVGGLLGGQREGVPVSEMNALDSYWNSSLTGASIIGEGKSAAELSDAATFTGWDFDSVWMIGDAFPELQ